MNIEIYTDGSCEINPGPAGIGVLLKYGEHIKKYGKYIGKVTNNIAELTAIKDGLEAVTDRSKSVVVHTDSQYCIGVLSNPEWNPKKNKELIEEVKTLMVGFSDIKFKKVKAHAGDIYNNIVDKLAGDAWRDHNE